MNEQPLPVSPSMPRDLSRPLPAEFAQGEFGTGWFYERYPTFSWGWAWRRSLLFGAFTVPYGVLLGVIHGLYSHDLSQGLGVGLRSALAMLLLVFLAPSLAAVVRHRRLPLHTERPLLTAVVVLGIGLSALISANADDFHNHLMGYRFTGFERLLQMFTGEVPLHSVFERSSDFVTGMLLLAVGGGALALRAYFAEPERWRELETRRELAELRAQKLATEARLSVLQAQVEPHFLFNTLASVGAQIQADPARASELCHALADYLRSTLPRLRADGVPSASTLGEQFEICRQYLEVMSLRLPGRLSVRVDLPPTLASHPFPPLLLISLVENAVKHGIEPRRGAGHIELRAHVEVQGSLEVLVRDDGPGLCEGLLEGTGMSNVRLQLQALYGPAARLAVESPVEGGVRASIRVPLEIPS
jgi:hypothetical protein